MGTSPGRHLRRVVAGVVALTLALAGCGGGDDEPEAAAAATTTTEAAEAVRIDHLQMIGSHNSYKRPPREELGAALEALAPALLAEIDYGHLPLAEQLGDHGIRQIEIDVLADPEGGLYATPAALEILGIEEPPERVMESPGFKVQHIQDVDFETHCPTFVTCLAEVQAWSTRNPDHLPVMIMVETKTGGLADDASSIGLDLSQFDAEFATAPAMTEELFDDLEAEILSVFDEGRIITPDDVRGGRPTLEEGVLEDGWPTVEDSRGKVLFALVDTGDSADVYRDGHPSLEGRLAFTSATPGEPDAAFLRVDDSLTDGADLDRWAEAGYLIRTRTDVPAVHAVEGDTTLRDAALASGGHYLSTDFYVPHPDSGYEAALPDGAVARCNPLTAPPSCQDEDYADG